MGLQNLGNTPVTVHLVGSPAYWNFTTTLSNVTLDPAGLSRTASGEVRIAIPAGTLVQHPAIVLSIELANGTIVGTVTAVPTVNVETVYGLILAPTTSATAQVGLTTVLVPFAVTNTGNVVEGIGVSVVDRAHLSALGWSTAVEVNGVPTIGPVNVNPGSAQQFLLNLTQSGPAAVPPGTATVAAFVTNATGGVQQSLTLTVPTTSVNIHPTFLVTGPSVGTAPAVYSEGLLILLALLPAIIVGAIALVYRWNRSRRWRQW